MSDCVTALIFCGGKATRLESISQGKPKALMVVSDTPFIIRLINFLCDSGVANICLSLSDANKPVVSVVRSWFGDKINLTVSYDSGCVENAGALNAAISCCDTDFILAINGDTFLDVDVGAFISAHVNSGFLITVAVSSRVDQPLTNNISLIDDAINSYSTCAKQGEGYTHCNTGWALIDKELYVQHSAFKLPRGKLEVDVYPGMAVEGVLGAYDCRDSYVLDIGTPSRYERAVDSEALPW